jgi:hypothetical protein
MRLSGQAVFLRPGAVEDVEDAERHGGEGRLEEGVVLDREVGSGWGGGEAVSYQGRGGGVLGPPVGVEMARLLFEAPDPDPVPAFLPREGVARVGGDDFDVVSAGGEAGRLFRRDPPRAADGVGVIPKADHEESHAVHSHPRQRVDQPVEIHPHPRQREPVLDAAPARFSQGPAPWWVGEQPGQLGEVSFQVAGRGEESVVFGFEDFGDAAGAGGEDGGTPTAMASMMTRPKGSGLSEAWTRTSRSPRTAATSRWKGTKWTRGRRPRERTEFAEGLFEALVFVERVADEGELAVGVGPAPGFGEAEEEVLSLPRGEPSENADQRFGVGDVEAMAQGSAGAGPGSVRGESRCGSW